MMQAEIVESAERLTKSKLPDVSVVIAAQNSWHFLRPCLASIHPGELCVEIIVVDNGSTDGTTEHLRRHFPGVRLLRSAENRGHCYAINRGMETATGEYIMVLDADTELRPGLLARLVSFMRERTDVSIVAPRMLNPDGSIQMTARRFPRAIHGIFGRQSIATRLFPRNRISATYMQEKQRDTRQPFEADWVSAACMMFRRSILSRIGLWDEAFAGYWVDADWCKRVSTTGKVVCVADVEVVHHEQNRSGRKKGMHRILSFHAGANRFYRKHYTLGWLDPRAVLGAIALGARAVMLMVADLWLPAAERKQRATSEQAGLGRKEEPTT